MDHISYRCMIYKYTTSFFDVALETIWVYESKSFAEIYNFPQTRLVCFSKESVIMKLLPGILPQHFFTMCQWPCLSCWSLWFKSYYCTEKLGQNPTGFLKMCPAGQGLWNAYYILETVSIRSRWAQFTTSRFILVFITIKVASFIKP